MTGRPAATSAALAVLALLLLPAATAQATLTPAFPQPGQVVRTGTPTLVVNHTGTLEPGQLEVRIDGLDLSEEEYRLNPTNVSYEVPGILKLKEGNHTFSVAAGGERVEVAFTVNYTIPPEPAKPLDVVLVVTTVGGSVLAVAGAGAGLYAWARKRHRFTFRKHFLRHPEQVRFITLYIPSGIAVLAGLGAAFAVITMAHPPRYAMEYVLVAGAAGALGPFGVSSLRQTLRTRAYERAFAQFLFELADAVRGGIDPVKAVQELAKTDDGLLGKHIQRASDLLRLGRPMDEALKAMTQHMGSPLVSRYAALVGEASSMGGTVSSVMQRAAKDMDDLVKIKAERRRALRQPVFTMYMAFGVMLVMILQIVGFAPNIGDISLAVLTGGEGAKPTVPRMGLPAMQAAFFHLLLVNAAGSGLLVGSFQEGRIRNGILHAIAMAGVAALVYPLVTSGVGAPEAAASAATLAGAASLG